MKLTKREQEILQLLATGATAKEVGARLEISPRTVQYHVSNIFDALCCTTTVKAVMIGLAQGLIVNPLEKVRR